MAQEACHTYTYLVNCPIAKPIALAVKRTTSGTCASGTGYLDVRELPTVAMREREGGVVSYGGKKYSGYCGG